MKIPKLYLSTSSETPDRYSVILEAGPITPNDRTEAEALKRWRQAERKPHGEAERFNSRGQLRFDTLPEADAWGERYQRANAGDWRAVLVEGF